MVNEVKPVKIIVDSRETRSNTARNLSKFPGVCVETEELSSGDYILASGVACERKSADDLIASIMDGRIFDQIARMKIEYEKVIVMIEGDPYRTRSQITPEAIDGALSWIALLSDVNTIFSPTLDATPRILWRLSLHATHGLGYEIPLRHAKPKAPSVLAQYLVEGLPSVGPTTAQNLLSYFKTPLNVFDASIADLQKVKGIAAKTANTIYNSLRVGR